jgi:hypothetical protein
MDISGVVDLSGQGAGFVGGLLAREDMEVIVRRMPAGVALSTDSRAKDDQVSEVSAADCKARRNHGELRHRTKRGNLLGDRGMDDVHAPHGSSSIIKHPLRSITEINLEASIGVLGYQLLE